MTTRIQRDFTVQAGVYYDKHFQMNIYEVNLGIDVETESLWEQNIAMERISFFLNEYLENSILIKDSEKTVIGQYVNCNFKVCTLPEEPYEQIVTIMLLTKLNAITEGRFVITDLSLCSKLSSGVTYLYDYEESPGPFILPGWWSNPNASISDTKPNKKDKIVQLFKTHSADWSEFSLAWKEKTPKLISEKPGILFSLDEK